MIRKVFPGLLVWSCVFLASCATPVGEKVNKISRGMSKAQVVEIMGPPTTTVAHDSTELLRYSLNAKRVLFSLDFDEYTVRLVDGKVESYGRTSELPQSGKTEAR